MRIEVDDAREDAPPDLVLQGTSYSDPTGDAVSAFDDGRFDAVYSALSFT